MTKPSMEKMLHICWNPHGWSEEEVRNARQHVADAFERTKQQLEKAKGDKLRIKFANRRRAELYKKLLESQAREWIICGALEELKDLMDAVGAGTYHPDSFTTQPARYALAIPHDDTALRVFKNAVLEECAKAFAARGEVIAADEVAAEIRNLKSAS